jgi:uncharacterized protein YjbI with pentapeptide repeats
VQAAVTVLGRREPPAPRSPWLFDLARVDLRGAFLISANLRGAFLDGANFQDAKLYSANLQHASLRDANRRVSTFLRQSSSGITVS